MRRGRTVAFYVLMSAFTLLACLTVVAVYFGYRGATLPRIGAQLTGDWLMERDDEMGFVPPRNASTEIRYVYERDASGRSPRWFAGFSPRTPRLPCQGRRPERPQLAFLGECHLPRNRGGRRSRNASRPSLASAVA